MLTSLLSARLAAAGAAAALALGGATAAAYAGALPASMQKFAHDTVGAPPAHPAHPGSTATPTGPNAAGHAAFGLCTAYAHLKAHGSAQKKAVAFRNLAAAAGGAANIKGYCAAVAHPGTTQPSPSASHPTGQPSTRPTGQPSTHPTGKPSSHPTGKPSSHPTGQPSSHPTGKPTSAP